MFYCILGWYLWLTWTLDVKKRKTILHSEFSLATDAITKMKLSPAAFGYDVFEA